MKTLKYQRMVYSFALAACVAALHGCATSSQTRTRQALDDDTRAYLEMLRSDFNTVKIRTLNQAMKLTEAEAEKFWPIYRSYEKELAAVGDSKLALIREFFAHHRAGTLSETNSKKMADEWLQNTQDRLDLWRKYHRQISEAISPVRAAQFLQVENQMALFVDINIASEMPVVGSKQ